MDKKDEEIQKKLQDLEKTVLKESTASQPPQVITDPKLLGAHSVSTTGSNEDVSIQSEHGKDARADMNVLKH